MAPPQNQHFLVEAISQTTFENDIDEHVQIAVDLFDLGLSRINRRPTIHPQPVHFFSELFAEFREQRLIHQMMAERAIAAAATASGAALAGASPALVIYDSRLPASRAFAKGHAAPTLDVAKEDENFWRRLRATAPEGIITGMTAWSDWVIVRGLLEEQGKRLKHETGSGALFARAMA